MAVRALAARTLAPVIAQGKSLTPLFDAALNTLPPAERGLFQQLCFGTLRQYQQLQAVANCLLDKQPREKDSDVYALILIGLYQLMHLRIADHAALSETVNACRRLKKPWASRLVNGVLRNFQRKQAELQVQLQSDDEFRFSHPQWLVERLRQAWPQDYADILDANNRQPPLCLRVNQQQQARDAYLSALPPDLAAPLALSPVGLRLQQSADIRNLPGFAEGHFSVQDEAAQLAAPLLDLQPGQRVLDACAAPGGKSCHVLEHEPALKELLCLDQDQQRCARIDENIQRLQLKGNVRVVAAQAEMPENWWDGQCFDRILLDAPCSATGVIRRHPDIKLLRRPGDLAKLAALQGQILRALWQTLAAGGKCLYATCSVLPEENEAVIEAFLSEHADAQHTPIEGDWGISRPVGRQLFPQTEGHDGFYYALLSKLPVKKRL